jgi:Flp pilus assembly protein protease CpaA
MSWTESILRLCVLILMLVMGIQDLRTRRVSNWLTIPFFFAGLIANGMRAYSDLGLFQLVLFIQVVVIFAGYHNWMGGADMKVFGGLLGLIPEAGIAAIIASGVVGGILWAWTGRRDVKFPAVTVSAFAMGVAVMISMYLPKIPIIAF